MSKELETIAADMAEALQAWLGSTHDQWVFSEDGKFIGESLDSYRAWEKTRKEELGLCTQ